jgi:hypothetical protein
MLPLPVPERDGSIETLRSFLNLPSRNDFVLIVAWLLAALRAGGPLLAISGEQGSAKTVLSKLLKALIDPNAAPVRALSREERELMIAANNSHVLAFDNLSGLPVWLSDAFCRLATGGSFAVRQLYTDDEEMLFEAARPILLNGIEEVISRPDLGERAIFLTLGSIGEVQRRAEAELWREFESARPASWGLCSTRWCMACAVWLAFSSSGYRVWPISLSGPRLASQHFGLVALSRMPTQQTIGRRSRASSKPIPSPPACVRSWQIGPCRLGARRDLLRLCAATPRDAAWAKNSAGACRAPAAGADVSANAGHRGLVLSRRPDRDADDQGEHNHRGYRQHRQHS